MADDREKISTGPNESPINETIAGTGPGIPDEALAPGEDMPRAPSDEEIERARRALGLGPAQDPQVSGGERLEEEDDLPLEGQ